ncbi:MAG: hypothetical protein JNJ69_16120 [Leptospiraceae bacterium]|nr:hypothetical protein [Leptospiraceae bacterium]
MGFLRRYSVISAVYLFAGIAVLLTHYLQTSPYNRDALDEKLTLVSASHFNLSQLVDNLPAVFRENPHAAALKISDLKGSFLGAMYDSRRMSGDEYRRFLDTRLFESGKEVLPGYQLHIWESKRRKLRIVALSLKRARFAEYLAGMGRDYALHYIIPLYLLAGVLGILAFHYFFRQGKFSLPRPSVAKKSVSSAAPSAKRFPANPKANAWQLRSGAVADGSINGVLEKLRSLSGAVTVSLFVRQRKDWSAAVELRGSLVIRGEAMEVPALLLHGDTESDQRVISPDKTHWFFFNTEAKTAQLCFALLFPSADDAPQSDVQQRISELVRTHSRSLIVEHYYENSIIDAESGLYSNPYAMFSMKERILAGLPFSVATLRFADADLTGAAAPRTARTAIRILRENFEAERAPVIARGSGSTMLIIFHAAKTPDGKTTVAVNQLINAYANLGKKTAAALVEDAAGCGGGQRVLKILDQLLDRSAHSGKLEIYKTERQLNVI